MTPPDPLSSNPRELAKFWFLLRRFSRLADDDRYNQLQLMTMSAVDFLDQWFETDVLKATMAASGIIGTFLGIPIARHGLCAAAPLHGRDRRRVSIVGVRARRYRRHLECDCGCRAGSRRRDSHARRCRADRGERRTRNRSGARKWRPGYG
jgi:hypothetical protein